MSSIDLIITFDTEDTYTPAEAGMDDVPKALAEILSEEGVPGHFIVIGDRARLLRDRGRDDVIAALKQHCIGVHTLHEAQPYEASLAADLDWDGGLDVVRRMEREAYRLVAEGFDCEPVCLSGHACNVAPQQAVVAREMGLPFLYSNAGVPPLNGLSRYCGTLNLPCFEPEAGQHIPYFDYFDDHLSDEPGFEQHLERFARFIDDCIAQGQPALLLHPCHPFKVYSLDWVDFYLSPNGQSIPSKEWPVRRRPGLRTKAQVELALRNFRRLAQFIAAHPRLNVVTIPQVVASYGRVPEAIGRLDLMAAAQRVCAAGEVAVGDPFTPAELALGFAAALLAYAQHGSLPESVARESDVLGPTEDPLVTPEEPGAVGWPALLQVASDLTACAAVTGHLPANLTVRGGRAGLGSIYHLLARAYLALCLDGREPEGLDLWRFPRQPQVGVAIGLRYTSLAESLLAAPNLEISNLYRHGKLQSWTLAPAAKAES